MRRARARPSCSNAKTAALRSTTVTDAPASARRTASWPSPPVASSTRNSLLGTCGHATLRTTGARRGSSLSLAATVSSRPTNTKNSGCSSGGGVPSEVEVAGDGTRAAGASAAIEHLAQLQLAARDLEHKVEASRVQLLGPTRHGHHQLLLLLLLLRVAVLAV